ncbi:NAD-dependent epimerase/dehydratase family protein [Escherichia coli]|uniref:NAD-dependent epimerase/dehydratase family protein n=1 Tax=Escherichia coli TaxID=562 RepID=UPI001939DCEE|nr:NAD-dependent epimerase/dehydratase family protein [Escherichia coli]
MSIRDSDRVELARVCTDHQPDCVLLLAEDRLVVRSIEGPAAYMESNLSGPHSMRDLTQS